MGQPKVTIDGRPVSLFGFAHTANAAAEPGTSFEWELTFGVESPVVTWELQPELAAYVLGRKEVSLHLEGVGRPPLDVKRAVVIGQIGGLNPRRIKVQFGDIRRYLKYTNPIVAANERARTGNNSTNGFGASGQFIQAIPAFAYRLYSVNSDGTPIVAPQVIKKVMNLASQSPSDWVLDAPPRSALIPNNIHLYERGDISVSRMLGTIGGLDIYVHPADGLMHIKPRVMGDERSFLDAILAGQDTEGRGKIIWRDESHNRPASFDMIFDPEMEFRSDYVEVSSGTITPKDDLPTSENVFEVMEYRLGNYLATTPSGRRQSLPGEYLGRSDYLATMPNGPLVASLPLSLLQQGFNNTDLIYGILGDGQKPDPGEEARIKSALGNYRQTFRVNRRWISRCRPGSLRALMVSVSDAERGERKPSDVYCEHCVIPTLEVALGNATNALGGWNRDSFPPLDTTANGVEKVYDDSNGATPSLLSNMRVAPFNARIIDSDAGLYCIEARPDFLDEREDVVPCRVLNIPTLDYTQANNSLALYFWDQSPVAANHRMTVILSAIPGVGEYHVPVSVAQASQRLGVGAKPGIAPTMSVRIGNSILTARFPWDDAQAKSTYDAFDGTFVGTDKDPLVTMKPANLQDLIDYAISYCAAVLAGYLDHYDGLQVIPLAPGAVPTGSMHTVVHRIGPRGDYTTTLNCTAVRDPFIADHFLTASSLANINGRVTT